jgi:hypothetical protein
MKAKEVRDGILLDVYVKPSSKRDAVLIHDEVQIETRDPPQRGKANQTSIKLLARALQVLPSDVVLVRGSTERCKIFLIKGLTMNDLGKRLRSLAQE